MSVVGPWVYFPSFFHGSVDHGSGGDAAAAMRLQAAWRRRKARATFSFCLREVCAVKIQLAARRYLLGRKGRNSSAYWALPLTTLVLERLSTSRVSGVHKDKKPQATALLNAKIAISLASLAVLSAALVVGGLGWRGAAAAAHTPPAHKTPGPGHTTVSMSMSHASASMLDIHKAPAGGLPGGAAGQLSSSSGGYGGLLSLGRGGGSVFASMTGGANGSAPATLTAAAPTRGAWAVSSSHGGAALAAGKTAAAPLGLASLGPLLLAPLCIAAATAATEATAALMRSTATLVEHARLILQTILRRAKKLGGDVLTASLIVAEFVSYVPAPSNHNSHK